MIEIRKRNIGELLIFFIVIFSSFCLGLKELIRLPNAFNYSMDLAVLILLILEIVTCFQHRSNFEKAKLFMILWTIVYFFYVTLSYCWNYQSIFYYINGFRNTFRFYIFFIACILFLTKLEIEFYFKIFDYILFANVIICTFQFFILGKKGDYLGGIFGTQQGCNAYMNTFLVFVITKSILSYLGSKESIKLCLLKFLAVLYIASLAEIKIVYVELIVIILLAVLITKFTWKKFVLMIGGTLLVIIGIITLLKIFPEWTKYASLQGAFDIVTSEAGYTGYGDLNRLTALQTINNEFFHKLPERLFGYGLGNCDYAALDIFVSPFYRTYKYLHHTWLSTAIVYFETGIIGMIFHFGFFLIVFFVAIKKYLEDKQLIYQFTAIMSLMCVVIGIYNNSMRTDAGYIAYLPLAFAFVNWSQQKNAKGKE